MKYSRPLVSSIRQIISHELLHELNATIPSEIGLVRNWGANRVRSLKHRDTPVKSQWAETCGSFATIAAIENKFGNFVSLSERSLWNLYRTLYVQDAIDAARKNFILDEKHWPQRQPSLDPKYKGMGRYKIASEAFLGMDYERVIAAIDNGNPCIVAMAMPLDLYNLKAQVESSSTFMDQYGHATSVSGYKVENEKAYFLVKNSWGMGCGDNGYQYVSFELFNKRVGEFAVFWEIKEVFDRGEQVF